MSSPPLEFDSLALYLRQAAQHPLLTHAQEMALGRAVRMGSDAADRLPTLLPDCPIRPTLEQAVQRGKQARTRLVEHNQRLVIALARRYQGQGMPLLDLIQEGNLGLLRAVAGFDPARGYRFSTYATWWIQQSMHRALARQGRALRIPIPVYERLPALYRAMRLLEQRLQRPATPAELAAYLELDQEWVCEVLARLCPPLSLELPLTDEGQELGELLPSTEQPETALFRDVTRHALWDALRTLPAREAQILVLRFGLNGDKPLSLEKIGQRLGVTRERVRQIQVRSLAKLAQQPPLADLWYETPLMLALA